MKFFIFTLGCKVNKYESEAILEMLSSKGFTKADCLEDADIVIINSCTVTSESDRKVRQVLNRAKRENPNSITVLCGCMPQAIPSVANELENADVILGNSNRKDIVPSIMEFINRRYRIICIKPYKKDSQFEDINIDKFDDRTRAFIKIEDGCNRFCSYCIIPYARGRVRSKSLCDIYNEACDLANVGYKEIVLVGINLSCYGQDIGLNLCDAIESICSIDGIKRVRLSSIEPERMSLDVINRLSKQEKLCPQFHLSLQSGCTETLKRMNRHYTAEEYLEIVNNLRGYFKNSSITTDIMVGFPGETEEEFNDSLNFVRKVKFSKTHVFPYSRRPGTKADLLPNQIENKLKNERSRKMIDETSKLHKEFMDSQIGTTQDVLFEQLKQDGYYCGYTPNYTYVRILNTPNTHDIHGKILKVKIISSCNNYCEGELVI